MGDLQRLRFGHDDAESDFAEDGLLRDGFLKTAAYEATLAGDKRLIIGRKGSGKTAICMVVAGSDSAAGAIAVGTALAGAPPRRSQRALLTHWAPALGLGVEPLAWEGMHHAGGW